MSLLAVRDKFLEVTGRYDLGTIGGEDDGANWFINAGQRYLDGLVTPASGIFRYQKDITSGTYKLSVPRVRSIKSVWASDGETTWRLVRASGMTPVPAFEHMLVEFGKHPSNVDSSTPLYWAPNADKLTASQDTLTSDTYDDVFTHDSGDITFGAADYQNRSILLMPPADATYTIKVFGLFFSKDLSDDDDASYWTEMYPDLLIFAAAMKMEQFYRNTEGSRDWQTALHDGVQLIDFDQVDEEMRMGEGDQYIG